MICVVSIAESRDLHISGNKFSFFLIPGGLFGFDCYTYVTGLME